MRRIHVFLLSFLLFVSPNIAATFKFDYSIIQVIAVAIAMFVIVQRYKSLKSEFLLKNFIFVLLSFSAYKMMNDVGTGTRQSIIQIVGSPILLLAYSFPVNQSFEYSRDIKISKSLIKVCFAFYMVETFLAVVERLLQKNFFTWKVVGATPITFMSESSFRSFSLVGHPLYNSLVVSIAMAFFLISPMRPIYKFSLWSIGYASILCFNARAAMVINGISLVVYLLYTVCTSKKYFVGNKLKTILYTFFITIVGLTVIFKYNLGSRLLQMGLMDDSSAQVRVDAWSIFEYVDFGKLLIGYSDSEMKILMYHAHLWTTENFWIDQCFKFGLLFFSIYVLFYFFLMKTMLKEYSLFQKIFLVVIFIMSISINNSLSSNFLALFEFLFLVKIFSPSMVYRIFPQKTLLWL